jgi:hypothetical protein
MIRTILSITILTTVVTVASLKADPTPANTKQKQNTTTTKTNSAKTPKLVPVTPPKEGWSLVNGAWTHSDGYKFVNGQVMRVGTQTHKKPPKPPTKAEMEAATKQTVSKTGPKTPAEEAAAKAAQKQKNLAPRPASQTGTHL